MSDVAYSLSTNGNASGRNAPLVLVLNDQGGRTSMNSQGFGIGKDVCYTLNAVDVHAVWDTADSPPHRTAYAVDCRNGTINEWTNGTLQSKEQGYNTNSNNVVFVVLK